MIAQDIKAVADAILYEGYILYPYRKSSLKNQQRWTFGGLFPRAYAERGGGDRWYLQCECLVRGGDDAKVSLQLRFLQVAARRIGRLHAPAHAVVADALPPLDIMEALDVEGRSYLPWEEAVAREDSVALQRLADLAAAPVEFEFHFPAATTIEPISQKNGLIAGLILRETKAVTAQLRLSAHKLAPDVHRLTAWVENITPVEAADYTRRDVALPFSFASSHLILGVEAGAFVSLTDPPTELDAAAKACVNEGCWPVLAGEDGTTNTILAAPIILYDYPKIAPESDAELFDGTEIDEILILRILTMTDAEKREMASGDARAQAMLARLQAMTPADMAKLHGTWRNTGGRNIAGLSRPKPELASIDHGVLAVGNRVRLNPRKGGDIMDIALDGKLAVIEAIERDFDDRIHVAVVVEDDPGRDFGSGRFPGHRFFFAPEEVEPVAEDAA